VANEVKTGLRSKASDQWKRLTVGIFGRGAVSFLVAIAGVSVSNFVFHIFVSRLLGPAHYGVVGALLSILSLLAVPVGAAQLAVTQAVIGHDTTGLPFSLRKVTLRAFAGGLIAAAFLACIIPVLDSFLHIKSPWPLLLVGVWIPLATVGAVLQGALIGEYRFRSVAFAMFVGGGPVRLILGAGLVLAGFGVIGAVTATLLAQAFTTGSLLYSTRREMHSNHGGPIIRTSIRDMSLSIGSLASYTTFIGVDTFLARHFFSASVSGRYAAGAVAAHIALFVSGAIVTVAFPHLVDGKGISAQSRKTFSQALKITTVLGVVVAGGLTVFSGIVVQLLFGSSYAGATSIVGVLSFASAAIGVLTLLVYFHLARRSLVALTPWFGVVLAVLLISIRHQTTFSVAVIMLAVSVLMLVISGLPAVRALAAAAANDAADDFAWHELPQPDLDFSLVVPFYNPGSHLGGHVREVVHVLEQAGVSFEVLAISDGSTDHSEEQLEEIASEQLTVVRLEENQGKGAALRVGLSMGRGEYLGFIDGDGDLPAGLLTDCLKIIGKDHPDIIFGSKRHPDSDVVYPPMRHLYSWGYQQLNRVLFRLPIRDTQTGVKVIRRDVLAAVLPRMVEKRFAFDLELFVVARQQGFGDFVEMPVVIGQRYTSTVSIRSVRDLLQDTAAIFYRLWILRFYERDIPGTSKELLSTRALLAPIIPNAHRPSGLEESAAPSVPNRPRRILILNWRDLAHPKAGGAEVYTQNVANEWITCGHEVTLFCSSVDGRPSTEEFNGLKIIRRGSRLSVYREARRFYVNEGRDKFDLVVDEVNTRPFFAARWAHDSQVIALIHQVCRELWQYQAPFPIAFFGRYWLEPRWLRAYKDVPTVTVSEASKISLGKYGLTQVVVVPEGHGSIIDRPEVPREAVPTIVFIGRLEAHKRPDEAIRAFQLLRESTMPSAQLWVIGTGPMEEKLRRSAPRGVEFLGWLTQEEKILHLAKAHVLIVTSVREGWGLVVTEAAAVGTPIVAYRVDGLSDSVRASNGVLTAPNPKQLSFVLQELLGNWIRDGLPDIAPGGVVPWPEVAERILNFADSVRIENEEALRSLSASARGDMKRGGARSRGETT
jgi:glycosyltransferase involved in cell wall biosynthesis/O-antigen/teichoic acid export membrane protein